MAKLLLIESPGKLKKLSQILGPGWIVKASMGHVRELANDGEDSLGFDLGDGQIQCRYEPRGARAKKVLSELRQAVKQADTVYIATDPDREGETIGWHLQQALRLKQPRRIVYSEITAAAVQQAIAHPRQLDAALIAAGRARDCLDKLVGYKGSRYVVWPLNNGAKSMGRVQSATLHLICQREWEIQAFTPQDYWSVWVSYAEGFKAFYRRPVEQTCRSVPEANDDAAARPEAPESDRITTQAEADRLVAIAHSRPHQVIEIESKTQSQGPPPPFITSTLQQAAGSKLRFSPEKTMQVAQTLYEAGYITYMRTDSVVLAEPFQASVRAYLQQHDPTNLPQRATRHRTPKGSQAAHEAIRPTDVNRLPQQMQGSLGTDEARLYDMIWSRAIASLCCPVQLQKTRILTQSGEARWEARGQVVAFVGYTRYWNNLSTEAQLPPLQQGQPLQLLQAQADPKQTQPPPRYSEPKLVQLMERRGIGRPSTYAPTLKTLRERAYVQIDKGKLQPTALGLDLDEALGQLLPDLIQPEFTAQMEAALDAIASGQQDWQRYLSGWYQDYFAPALDKARGLIGQRPRPTIAYLRTVPEPAAAPAAKTPKSKGKAANLACPKCGGTLVKIPCRSQKLKADHFLRCGTCGCGTVMFWNPQKKQYDLPYAQRSADPSRFTDYPCPVCGALLERYPYQKAGQDREMLRCSLLDHRRSQCKEVAFFQGRDGFWSPKFGSLLPSGQTPR